MERKGSVEPTHGVEPRAPQCAVFQGENYRKTQLPAFRSENVFIIIVRPILNSLAN